MADDIPQGQPDFSISQEAHRFKAECREGGKSTKEADNQEGSSFACIDAALTDELSQKTNQHTSHKINCQGAEGELNALAQLLSIAAHQVAKDRANEPAGADEE